MLFNFKIFLKNRLILSVFFISLVLVMASIADIFFLMKAQSPVFLHYDVVMGVNLQGEWWEMYYIPLGGIIIMAVNVALALIVYPKNKLLSTAIMCITPILELILLISTVLIVRLNI